MSYTPLLILLGTFCSSSLLEQKETTLEDVWKSQKVIPVRIPGFYFPNDGKHCTLNGSNQIIQLNIRTGKPTK